MARRPMKFEVAVSPRASFLGVAVIFAVATASGFLFGAGLAAWRLL